MKISELMDSYCDDTVEIRDTIEVNLEEVRQKTRQMVQEAGREKRRPTRRMLGVLLAAALVVCAVAGGAVATVNPVRAADVLGGFIRREEKEMPLTEEEKQRLEDIGATADAEDGEGVLPSITSNGTTMTPLAAIYDGHQLYLQLKIETPEDTVFEDLGEGYCYHLTSTDPETGGYGYFPDSEAGWGGGTRSEQFSETEPNVLILTLDYTFWDGKGPSVMHIDGLALEHPDKEYTQILTGSWEFELGGVDQVDAITYPTNKLSYECYLPPVEPVADIYQEWLGGYITVTFDSDVEVTPLAVYAQWHYDESQLDDCYGFGHEVSYEVYYKDGTLATVPYELNQVDYVLVDGTLKLSADSVISQKGS